MINIHDAPKIIELAKLMAEKNSLSLQEVLTAIQITILARLTEQISINGFSCGESY